MTDEPETPDTDDELLLTEDDELEKPEGVKPEDEAEEIPTFGDDAEPQPDDNGLVKHLRAQIRERDKRLADAERSIPRQEPIVVGEKPTLAGCDYDEDRYDQERDAWEERKRKAQNQEQSREQAGQAEADQWQQTLDRYNASKAKLPYSDISDAEDNVKASLDTAQQAVLLMAADDPAKLAYALGRNPSHLAAIAAEKNPLKLAAQIAKLEGQLKMVQRRKPPEPDTPERGSGRMAPQPADKKLKKLEEEAERTGDRTAIVAYKKSLADAAKAKK